MQRFILPAIFTLVLAGCGDSITSYFKYKTVTVSDSDTTQVIDENEIFNLTISGSNNNVTIRSGNSIENLLLSGSSNILTIETDTTVADFQVAGDDNTIYVPVGSGISFAESGAGNTLIEQ